jgi:hypothetical protein
MSGGDGLVPKGERMSVLLFLSERPVRTSGYRRDCIRQVRDSSSFPCAGLLRESVVIRCALSGFLCNERPGKILKLR